MLSWSSGKDSAWALNKILGDPAYSCVGLFTTLNSAFDRVAMHAVRRELVEAQARAIGLPLEIIPIPHPCSNAEYEHAMAAFVESAKGRGVTYFAFGDLYLEDIRRYREEKLAGTGIEPIFPLWQIPTRALAVDMIAGGLRAYVTCVDPKQAPRQLAGRRFDASFLRDLPEGVDPCGERGEFHTFVTAGPMFRSPVNVSVGEVVERDGFVFADLIPAAA